VRHALNITVIQTSLLRWHSS